MELRLAQLKQNNRGKRSEMGPKQCVFDSHNNRIIMEYLPAHNQLFVAYATQEKKLNIPISFAKNLS